MRLLKEIKRMTEMYFRSALTYPFHLIHRHGLSSPRQRCTPLALTHHCVIRDTLQSVHLMSQLFFTIPLHRLRQRHA